MAPCSGVPLPGGSPAPSGGMLMSHGAISAAVAERPRPGVSCAMLGTKAVKARSVVTAAVALCVYIFHLTTGLYLPRLDGVVVKDCVRSVGGYQSIARRLDRTSFVGGTALQYGRGTVPLPRDAEARQRPGQYGI